MNISKEIEKRLIKLPVGSCVKKGEDYWVRCPVHKQGQERTPSLKINMCREKAPIGAFFCFGCSFSSVNFNVLAEKLRIPTLSKNSLFDSHVIDNTDSSRKELFEHDLVVNNSHVKWDETENWRGISGDLLSKLNARLIHSEIINDNQLQLPVFMFGKEVGQINCVLSRRKGQLGYFNSPGNWVKRSLFPYDFVKQRVDFLYLVEGPRDALNLLQMGFSALAILGTYSWSQEKLTNLITKSPKTLVITMDNDEAGQKAASKIYADAVHVMKTINLKLPSNTDPADIKSKKELISFEKQYTRLTS
jgi:DNA primase